MGGTLAMIVRKPDGDVVSTAWWTNSLPYDLADPKFLAGDFEAWWTKVEEGGEPLKTISPEGYGIVVVDFPQKTVLHAQGYTALGAEKLVHWTDVRPEEFEDIHRRHVDGRIPSLTLRMLHPNNTVSDVSMDVSSVSWDRLSKIIDDLNDHLIDTDQTLQQACDLFGVPVPAGADPDARAPITLAFMPYRTDWTFERLPDEDLMSFVTIKQRMESWGYSFSAKDASAWKNFLKERFDQDAALPDALATLGKKGKPVRL